MATARARCRRLIVPALALLLVVGCDGSGADDADDATVVDPVDPGSEPEVEEPEGPPPEGLLVEDLVDGDGEPVTDGAQLTLHYVGVTWEGRQFASTWDRGQPLTYAHGQGRWVEGWTQGLEGMRAGGRRRIVVPPELGYGQRGAPGVPAGATLVFVVDLVDVG